MTRVTLDVDSDLLAELVTSTTPTPLLNHNRYALLSPGSGWDLGESGELQWTRSLGDALIVDGYHRACDSRTSMWWDTLCDLPAIWVASPKVLSDTSD